MLDYRQIHKHTLNCQHTTTLLEFDWQGYTHVRLTITSFARVLIYDLSAQLAAEVCINDSTARVIGDIYLFFAL